MTIEYDEERKRATHLETGMAVEFDHKYPHAQERKIFFNLLFNGNKIPFQSGFDYGTIRYQKKYPNMNSFEREMKLLDLKIMDFYINDFDPGIDYLRNILPKFPDIFIQLFYEVVSNLERANKVSVYYRPYFYLDQGHWEIES